MATGLQSFAFNRPVTSLFCDLEKPDKKRSLLFPFKILNLKLQKKAFFFNHMRNLQETTSVSFLPH